MDIIMILMMAIHAQALLVDPAIPPIDESCGPSWASPPSACRRRRHRLREAGAGGGGAAAADRIAGGGGFVHAPAPDASKADEVRRRLEDT